MDLKNSFTWINILIAINLLLVHSNSTTALRFPNCPIQNATNGLSFIGTPGDMAITCEHHSIDLTCCAEGYKEIKWYREKGDNEWIEVNPTMTTYMPLADNNQTLRLVSPHVRYDKTKFRCIARDESNQTINNTINLDIRDCREWKEPPIIISLTSEQQSEVSVTLVCKVFIGPTALRDPNDIYNTIFWRSFIKDLNDQEKPNIYHRLMSIKHNDSIINITELYSGPYMYSRLTLKRSDAPQNHTCMAINIFGRDEMNMEINEDPNDKDMKKEDQSDMKYTVPLLVASILLLVSFIINVVLLIERIISKRNSNRNTINNNIKV